MRFIVVKERGARDFSGSLRMLVDLGPTALSHPQEVLALKIKTVLRAKVVEDFFNVGL